MLRNIINKLAIFTKRVIKITLPTVRSPIRKLLITCRIHKLKKQGVSIDKNVVFSNVYFEGKAKIEPYCRMIGTPIIKIGDGFYANVGCHFLGQITIGRNVIIGPKTVIWGRDHGIRLNGIPIKYQDSIYADIIIGDDVWIAANVTILKGVVVGGGAVIGAGSVVTKNIPEHAIVVGNPARVIKFRQ